VANLFIHSRYTRDAAAKRAAHTQAFAAWGRASGARTSASQPCDVGRRGGVGLLSTSLQQVDSTRAGNRRAAQALQL